MLPKNLKYQSKVESAFAKSYRSNIAPQNGTGIYNAGDTIIINIPTRNNLSLNTADSILKFTSKFANGSGSACTARYDSNGAHAHFQRIRIFHGSNLLQDIDNYGVLAKMIYDLQLSNDANQGKFNILSGTRNDMVAVLPVTVGGPTWTADNVAADINTGISAAVSVFNGANLSVYTANSGETICSGLATGNNVSFTYCLNLISLIGSLGAGHYLPLWKLTSAPLRVEITLANSAYNVCNATQPLTITYSNVEFIGEYIELGDTAISMIESSLEGQPLQYAVTDYRSYSYNNSITTAVTQVQMPIPAKFSSLKSIFVMQRETPTVAGAGFFPYSFVSESLTDYQFRIGSQLAPSKAISTPQEMFCELMKAINTIGNIDHTPAIDKNSYYNVLVAPTALINTTASQMNITQSGSFYIGLDCELYSGANKDSIFAGMNTLTSDIYAILDYPAAGAITNLTYTAIAMFDSVLVFENGTAYVNF